MRSALILSSVAFALSSCSLDCSPPPFGFGISDSKDHTKMKQGAKIVPRCTLDSHIKNPNHKRFKLNNIFTISRSKSVDINKPVKIFEVIDESNDSVYWVEFPGSSYHIENPTEDSTLKIGDRVLIGYNFEEPPNLRARVLYARDIHCISRVEPAP